MPDGCAVFRCVVLVMVVFFFFSVLFLSFGYGSRSQRQPTRAQSPFRWLFIRRRPHPIYLAHKVISRRFLCTRGSPLFFSFKFQLRVRVGLFISDAWVPFAVRCWLFYSPFFLPLDLKSCTLKLSGRWVIRSRPHPYFVRKMNSGWFLCSFMRYIVQVRRCYI